jgi:hypothetical protein
MSSGRSVQALVLVRRAASLKGIRDDEAGKFLAQLVSENGGVGATEKLLDWGHTTLQKLMRTPGRVPHKEQLEDLARVSGKRIEEIRRIFGPRKPAGPAVHRTPEVLAAVRERFPKDRLRIAVVNRIEQEHTNVDAYARAAGVGELSLHWWLIGKHQNLAEPSLRAILEHEGIRKSTQWIKAHSAQASRHRHIMRLHRKLRRRKHIRRSPRHREAIAEGKQKQWADPTWRTAKGEAVIEKMQVGRRSAWADEEKSLASLIRLAVGKYRSQHRTADPADALRVLCRIMLQHRRRVPSSSLKFEDLPEKIEKEMGAPLHTLLHATGRRYSAQNIATIIRVLADSPPQKWRVASTYLYGDNHSAEAVRRWWQYTAETLMKCGSTVKHQHPTLLETIAMSVLRDAAKVRAVLHRAEGRPPQRH